MSISMVGQQVVITGGTGALGSSVVERMLEAGADCHVTWVAEKELERFELADRVRLHQVDCTDEQAVTDFYGSLGKLWASLNIVGGFDMGPIENITADAFEKMHRMNALTCFLCCREAVKQMRKVGGGGRIVNVSARPAVRPTPGLIAYSASKASVANITESLAEEVKDEDILVNAVLPSIMDTPGNRSAMPDADFEKWPKTRQVAEAIAFLACPDNVLTHGGLVPVYGKM